MQITDELLLTRVKSVILLYYILYYYYLKFHEMEDEEVQVRFNLFCKIFIQ